MGAKWDAFKSFVSASGHPSAFEPGAAVDYVRSGFDNVNKQSGQPGVGSGPAANPGLLQQDPATGVFFDPTTGRSYLDPAGTQVVADPNLAQQTAANYQRAGGFYGKIAGTDVTLDRVDAGQNNLLGTLHQTMTDPNAPSVARAQLAQTVDQNGRQILGTAAGVGGNNAYDARRAALSTLAGANTAAAGNAAVLRQKEVQDATSMSGNVLGQQAQQAQARQNANLSAGADLTHTAATSQAQQQGIQQKTDEANQTGNFKKAGAALSFLSGMG